jgi:hypothetical protein
LHTSRSQVEANTKARQRYYQRKKPTGDIRGTFTYVAASPAKRTDPLAITMHESSVGVFSPYLGNLADILELAEAHATARKIDPQVLLRLRLAPDMFDLSRQGLEAIRHAVLGCGLLADVEPPKFGDKEPDFAELKARISATIAFMRGLSPAAIDQSAEREVVFTFRNGATRKFTGKSLLLTFTAPQFFFHVTTAYDILRHNGVALIKKNFLGSK